MKNDSPTENLKIIPDLALFLLGVIFSFTSYCIFQLTSILIIPMTIFPIMFYILSRQRIPSLAIFVLGLIDDIMFNSHLGVYPLIYLMSAYITLRNNNVTLKLKLSVFMAIYATINAIYFNIFS
jgi:cell shape-determining protein MreD